MVVYDINILTSINCNDGDSNNKSKCPSFPNFADYLVHEAGHMLDVYNYNFLHHIPFFGSYHAAVVADCYERISKHSARGA